MERREGHDPVTSVFSALHPTVASWAQQKLRCPTQPQLAAIPAILAGQTVLLASPTGTGKTLAAFLPQFSRLAERIDRDELYPRPVVLYVSPLRALGYDIEHNARRPLREMGLLERPGGERAERRRGRLRERTIRTGVRTGDTPQVERRLMMARPPHILITTPESLALMMALRTHRLQLRHVECVIVDEIHALASNKRGAQLALHLESLEEICGGHLQRIGLSATVAPLERVAAFLAGVGRPCEIVDARELRSTTLRIAVPFSGAMAPMAMVSQSVGREIESVRGALVFCNVRSQAERVAHELSGEGILGPAALDPDPRGGEDVQGAPAAGLPERRVGVHHSAIERSLRHRVEAGMRSGELHAVVCSSSLELGIDVGFVERVCIVGGARGVAATLQRVGRAGHVPGGIAQGVVVAQDRDDIIEAAATRRLIADGVVEEIAIPDRPLDVLAQWLVGCVVPDRELSIQEALRIARRALPYAALDEVDLRDVVTYLAGGGAGGERAHVSRVVFDGTVIRGPGREAASAYYDNAGTIPDTVMVTVVGKDGGAIGRIEEDFAHRLQTGDTFLLSGRALRVVEARGAIVRVAPHRGKPTVPRWSSHMRGATEPLASEIGRLRRECVEVLRAGGPRAAAQYLSERYGLEGEERSHVVRYIAQQLAVSDVADDRHAVVEIYRFDGAQNAIYHTCIGRRVNETLARAAAARVHAAVGANCGIASDDNGFMVSLPLRAKLADAQWAGLLHPQRLREDLMEGLLNSYLLRGQFRHVANTGLLILRRAGGMRVTRQSWQAERIFERLWRADRRFPLIRETVRHVLYDLLDFPGAQRYVEGLPQELRVIHPPAASPFSFGIVTSSFADTVVVDDRATLVEALHERILALTGDSEEIS
ncbi:DEAD/DEAH box helicase [bacterium]|nr:MAG: DEAD/DEAH box helicase [bacterium]